MAKEKSKTVTVKLNENYYSRFMAMAENFNGKKTNTVKALIDGQTYISRPEVAANAVMLTNAINALAGENCDLALYKELRKAGEELCRSLLTN